LAPSAGPTGGAGVALPASRASFIMPTTAFRRVQAKRFQDGWVLSETDVWGLEKTTRGHGPFLGLPPPGLGGAMALTASVRRKGAAVCAGASGRKEEAGAPRNGEESFLAGAWEGRPCRDNEVVAMAVFMATRWRGAAAGDKQQRREGASAAGFFALLSACLLSNPETALSGGAGSASGHYAFSQGKRLLETSSRWLHCSEHVLANWIIMWDASHLERF
jgi:hypothetical protein